MNDHEKESMMKLLERAGFSLWAPVLINDAESYNDAAEVCVDGETSYSKLQNFLMQNETRFGLEPVMDAYIPMGKHHDVFLWQSSIFPGNPNFMIGHVFEKYQKEGENFVRFSGIVCGDKFQGLVRYRKNCCGKEDVNISSYVTVFGQNGRQNVVGDGLGTKDRFKQLLNPSKNPRALLFSTHMIEHTLAHANSHGCSHNHGDDLPKVSALMPAPSM